MVNCTPYEATVYTVGGLVLAGAGAAAVVASAVTTETVVTTTTTVETANAVCGGDICSSEAQDASTFIRYMSEAELKVVQNSGMLRGGSAGPTYWTAGTEVFETVGGATSRLALKTPPDIGVAFQIINRPDVIGPEPVEPLFSHLGGGIQYVAYSQVAVNILSTWDLIP
ncbi:hypothetical protein GW781_13450 [bacterium]|nr:hypothetical protein [bacterium]